MNSKEEKLDEVLDRLNEYLIREEKREARLDFASEFLFLKTRQVFRVLLCIFLFSIIVGCIYHHSDFSSLPLSDSGLQELTNFTQLLVLLLILMRLMQRSPR